jgi:hypothetical protein
MAASGGAKVSSMKKDRAEEEKPEPAPFASRPKAPPLVRIVAAIALLLLLAGMYLYAARQTSAAGLSPPLVPQAESPVAALPPDFSSRKISPPAPSPSSPLSPRTWGA